MNPLPFNALHVFLAACIDGMPVSSPLEYAWPAALFQNLTCASWAARAVIWNRVMPPALKSNHSVGTPISLTVKTHLSGTAGRHPKFNRVLTVASNGPLGIARLSPLRNFPTVVAQVILVDLRSDASNFSQT